MHDIAIIQGILDAVLEKASLFPSQETQKSKSFSCLANPKVCSEALGKGAFGRGKAPKQITLELEIGALKFVEPENARFWLKEMLKKEFGQRLKTKISVKTIEPEIKCKCGFQGRVKEVHATHDMVHAGIFEMHCPKCKGHDFETVKGTEVLIRGMEFK